MRPSVLSAFLLGLVGLIVLPNVALGGAAAPGFAGGGQWFNSNSRALTLEALRGKVVAVDMWTAGCYNCLNTLPYLKQWDARYRDKGLVIVGVHTPEFAHEGSQQFVRDAIARLGIKYAVVMDNEYRIWNAYHNRYWPTIYLIDRKGQIRYSHIGEGEYEATERMIARLLAEPIETTRPHALGSRNG